jgi:D-serine dehydratase
MTYDFIPEMGEISGFGGTYETGCRVMVKAGLEWFDKNPGANPQFHSYKNIYGIIDEDNKAAEELVKAMTDAVDKAFPGSGGVTGAMVQATVSTVLWIKTHSWQEYVQKMSIKRERSTKSW